MMMMMIYIYNQEYLYSRGLKEWKNYEQNSASSNKNKTVKSEHEHISAL